MTESTSTIPKKPLPNPGEHFGALALDLALGHWMRRRALDLGATDEAAHGLAVTAVLVAQERGRGHTCIQLPRWAGRDLMLPPDRRERHIGSVPSRETAARETAARETVAREDQQPFSLPALGPWTELLRQSPLVGRGTSPTPLVFGPRYRLYLYRYWAAEQRLSRNLHRLLEPLPGATPPDVSPTLQEVFQRLFPPPDDPDTLDHQALAASLALRRRLCLISGGPGTGKTTTVSRLLALWLHVDSDLRIGLAAPTGKAAARLVESIAQQVNGLGLPPELLKRFPRQAATLHRLLGYQRRQGQFRHRAKNPLPYDLLVVDEASMVDLLMMDALADALPKGGRLILIGDQDQLSSVETGYVFGDLCQGARNAGWSSEVGTYFEQLSGYGLPTASTTDSIQGLDLETLGEPFQDGSRQDTTLRDTAVELKTNYRFRSQPGIGALAQSIRDQHPHRCLDVLDDRQLTDVERQIHPPDLGTLLAPLRDAFRAVLEASDPQEALQQMEGFRVLAATRRGPWGVEQLNPRIDRWLQAQGWIDGLPALADDEGHRWYAGRPIMVTHNDYGVQLFNGDVGICAASEDGLRAFFPDGEGGVRSLALSKLPPHATAWAMTVHKSQGSEFDHVLLILPEKDSPLLTRELLYTAVTRARRRLTIAAGAEMLTQAIDRRSRRTSGLLDALRGGATAESAPEMPELDAWAPGEPLQEIEEPLQDVESVPAVFDTPPSETETIPRTNTAPQDEGASRPTHPSQEEPRQLSLFDPPPDAP